MNTTIDFKTAKTIENMSRKIDSMERAVSGFFNKMSDIAERKYGDPQVYLAAVGPARDLSAILLEEAPGILPCFDETDDTFGISKELPVAGCYNPKQVLRTHLLPKLLSHISVGIHLRHLRLRTAHGSLSLDLCLPSNHWQYVHPRYMVPFPRSLHFVHLDLCLARSILRSGLVPYLNMLS